MTQPIFLAVQDGRLYRWRQQRPGLTTDSREAFATLALAEDAAIVVAGCYCGLYRCPSCQQEYDPTFGKACPYCAQRLALSLFNANRSAPADWPTEGEIIAMETRCIVWPVSDKVEPEQDREDYIGL